MRILYYRLPLNVFQLALGFEGLSRTHDNVDLIWTKRVINCFPEQSNIEVVLEAIPTKRFVGRSGSACQV